MNFPLKSDGIVVSGKSAASGSKVRMIIHAEEHVYHAVFFRGNSEKSTHCFLLCKEEL